MKPVLVGSRALAHWLPKFTPRDDSDWDFISTSKNLPDYFPERREVHLTTELNNQKLCDTYTVKTVEYYYNVMSLEGLAVMKRSHLWRTKGFSKHIFMYHKFLADFFPEDEEGRQLLSERTKLTHEAYPQNNAPLSQSNKDFFDDNVDKKFDHDWLHELVAHYGRPMFERLKKPEKFDKAWCERGMWDNLPYGDKLMCLSEEAHVIACERFMIPSNWTEFEKPSYFKAVDKVCTTLTAGRFRDFAIDNWPELLKLYDKNKFKKVKEKTYVQD